MNLKSFQLNDLKLVKNSAPLISITSKTGLEPAIFSSGGKRHTIRPLGCRENFNKFSIINTLL